MKSSNVIALFIIPLLIINSSHAKDDRQGLAALRHKQGMVFNHVGIPSKIIRDNEHCYPHLKLCATPLSDSLYGTQWVRFLPGAKYPKRLRQQVHTAFTVNNLQQAINGKKVVYGPYSPSAGLQVAFIDDGGALIELMQFTDQAKQTQNNIQLLKDMFTEVTINKSTAAIKRFYHPDFILHTNGTTMSFKQFLTKHTAIYRTPIQYKISYDPKVFIEAADKVAARVFISTKLPNEKPHDVEVVLIAQFKDQKIYRLWEVTYPDWRQLKALK